MAVTVYLNLIETDWLGLVGVAVSSRGLLCLGLDVKSRQDFLFANQNFADGVFVFSETETELFTAQIQSYLAGELRSFSLPIDWSVYTPFQQAVLKETQRIPYGETRSYGQIAAAIARPRAARAVGQAEKRNQTPLVIPCHRVVGSDGSLTGYSGGEGVELKARIIAFEQSNRG